MRDNYYFQQKKIVKRFEKLIADRKFKTSIVDIIKDYKNDDRICLTSVVFIPKEISDKIISAVTRKLKKIESVHYFYSPESLHLTVKNIRTVNKPSLFTRKDIDKVQQLFKKIIPQTKSFKFYIEDVLVLPTSISVMAYSNDIFGKLVSSLDEGLKKNGVPDNKKYLSDHVFFGNITICRFVKKPSVQFINKAKKDRNLKIGNFKVKKISLITCNAVCHKKTRKIIAEYKLKN